MATMQIQKTRQAETTTKTAIDQKQSLEIVQTMLHGGLSNLAYLRNFFAEDAFEEQIYEMGQRIHPYKEYAAGNLVKQRHEAAKPFTVIRVLRRNRSKRVDMFLDWLEKGAFNALKAGHLQALKVFVHPEAENREKVLETYTFTIKYAESHKQDAVLVGIELDSPKRAPVSVEATNAALQSLWRQVVQICGGLPRLPEKRFVSMSLFYLPNLSKTYRPKGFVESTMEAVVYAQAKGWERRTDALKELNSSFHSTTLRVTSLQQPSQRALAELIPESFPKEAQFKGCASKYDDIDIASRKSDLSQATTLAKDSHVDAITPSTVIDSEIPGPHTSGEYLGALTASSLFTRAKTSDITAKPLSGNKGVPVRATSAKSANIGSAPATYLDDSLNTQSSNVYEMKMALQGMMHPEKMTQGDTQTQSLLLPPSHSRMESVESPYRLSHPLSKTSSESPSSVVKPTLSQSKADRLAREKRNLQQKARELARKTACKTKNDDLILCQCGFAKEEGDMVNCVVCNTWQHLHCYGFAGAADPRLPDNHTCYQCLCSDQEKHTLQSMTELALRRRAMHLALQHGLGTQSHFATELEQETNVARSLYHYLRSEGYVIAATGSRRTGYRSTGKPLFVAAREGPNYEKMLRELFDPLLHISHFYNLPAQPVSQHTSMTQRLLASQLDSNMPPPATPASVLRKKKATTPASGLDVPASITPLQTPSRAQQLHSRKRTIGEVECDGQASKAFVTPGSTFKRLRSLQTQHVLDARGMPSSPVASSDPC